MSKVACVSLKDGGLDTEKEDPDDRLGLQEQGPTVDQSKPVGEQLVGLYWRQVGTGMRVGDVHEPAVMLLNSLEQGFLRHLGLTCAEMHLSGWNHVSGL